MKKYVLILLSIIIFMISGCSRNSLPKPEYPKVIYCDYGQITLIDSVHVIITSSDSRCYPTYINLENNSVSNFNNFRLEGGNIKMKNIEIQ